MESEQKVRKKLLSRMYVGPLVNSLTTTPNNLNMKVKLLPLCLSTILWRLTKNRIQSYTHY